MLTHVTETEFTPAYFGGKTFAWPPGLLGEEGNRDCNNKTDERRIQYEAEGYVNSDQYLPFYWWS
jgi:hypothetical protein